MRQKKDSVCYRRILWLLMLVLILSGCGAKGGQKQLSVSQIHEFWAQLESYQATIQVTFLSNRGANTYTVQQQALSSGPYRMEIQAPEENKGVLTIFDGKKVVQRDPSIGMEVTAEETPVRNALFVFNFWEQYLRGQSAYIQGGPLTVTAAPEYSDTENPPEEEASQEEYMLETRLSGTHEKLAVERLWLSTQTGYPLRMVVYDAKGQASIQMEFLDFQPDIQLDPSLFTIS